LVFFTYYQVLLKLPQKGPNFLGFFWGTKRPFLIGLHTLILGFHLVRKEVVGTMVEDYLPDWATVISLIWGGF